MTLHLAPARLTALAEACAADIWDQAYQRSLHVTLYRQGTAATLVAGAITTAVAEAEPVNVRLLAALWRLAWRVNPYLTKPCMCQICGAAGVHKAAVTHAAGCALFGQDKALLASLDALEIKQGETL